MSLTTILSEAPLVKKGSLLSIRNLFLVCCGSAVLTLSAKISVPFYPVPITLQTLAVLLLGALLGFRLGFSAVALYLVEGAFGLPVFAGTPVRGIGIPYMLGPTGGYLLGFLLAVALVGYASDNRWCRTIFKTGCVMIAAGLSIHIPGLLWLAQFTGYEKVLEVGLFPFLLGDFLKISLATCVTSLRSLYNLRPFR